MTEPLPDIDVAALAEESTGVDFKATIDAKAPQAWIELVKDIAAFANSGGGVIVFGVNDDGSPSPTGAAAAAGIDPADITNKVYKYTGCQFSAFRIFKTTRGAAEVVVLQIAGVNAPLVFTSPGTYAVPPDNRQITVFGRGTVYFRHGAKSEPGTSDDLREFVERELERIRRSWLAGIAKVVEAPPDAVITVVRPGAAMASPRDGVPVRIVDDPDAPAVQFREEDILARYPHDYRSLTTELKKRYTDFIENSRYHTLRKAIRENRRYCHHRLLNPKDARTGTKDFFSEEAFAYFDQHYKRRDA